MNTGGLWKGRPCKNGGRARRSMQGDMILHMGMRSMVLKGENARMAGGKTRNRRHAQWYKVNGLE